MYCQISDSLIEEGKTALEMHDINLAVEYFSRAIIENNCDNAEEWSLLAESLFYEGQFEFSLECWHEAALRNPKSKKIWIRISALYALLQEDDLAAHYYKIAELLPIEE